LESLFHRTIKKVTSDIDSLKANTAIATMMSLINAIYEKGSINKAELKALTIILNPFAPHITEEMWSVMNFGGAVTDQKWPSYDEAKCEEKNVEIVIQINGKIREKLIVPADIENADAIALAKAESKIAEEITGKTIVKEFYIKGKLVNIVVK
ncbi:MAG: class I tRNA ligase family protein, partial [Oscillospiraceae bacterium]